MDLTIPLDRGSGSLLSHQIGRAVIDLIGQGALKAGDKLPSTRDLARQLGVSRMMVVEAYAWIGDQGYVDSRQGAPTTVKALPLPRAATPVPVDVDLADTPARALYDLKPGLPDLTSFPRKAWLAALTRSLRATPTAEFGYGDPLGHPRLRRAISAWLHRSRGFVAPARNIVITAGTAQAIDLMLRVLPGHREMLLEKPGAPPWKRLGPAHGARFREVPVDAKGVVTALLPDGDGVRRIACVVPSHQFPTGCVMSLERRLALIAWAERSDAYVIEDDYDAEFAFDGRPAMPLATLDPHGRVIYAGTFSKTLAPAIRIGFVVVPDRHLEHMAELKWWADRGGFTVQHDALAGWIEDGGFERHVTRMRKVYRDRWAVVVRTLTERLGDRVRITGERVGMHVVALVRSDEDAPTIAERALAKGVALFIVDDPFPGAAPDERAFVVGLGSPKLQRGCELFAAAVLEGSRSAPM